MKLFQLSNKVPHKRDRIALYATLTLPAGLVMALTKLILGVLVASSWLLVFGSYYLVLLFAKTLALWRYRQIRISAQSTARKITAEHAFLRRGGLFYILIGVALGGFCLVMYNNGYHQHFTKYAAILVAAIGFTKITSAIVGLVRARHLRSPLLSLLKAYNCADGMAAIVLTQYALLAFQHTQNVDAITGLFGLGVSAVIIIVGLWLTIITARRTINSSAED